MPEPGAAPGDRLIRAGLVVTARRDAPDPGRDAAPGDRPRAAQRLLVAVDAGRRRDGHDPRRAWPATVGAAPARRRLPAPRWTDGGADAQPRRRPALPDRRAARRPRGRAPRPPAPGPGGHHRAGPAGRVAGQRGRLPARLRPVRAARRARRRDGTRPGPPGGPGLRAGRRACPAAAAAADRVRAVVAADARPRRCCGARTGRCTSWGRRATSWSPPTAGRAWPPWTRSWPGTPGTRSRCGRCWPSPRRVRAPPSSGCSPAP